MAAISKEKILDNDIYQVGRKKAANPHSRPLKEYKKENCYIKPKE